MMLKPLVIAVALAVSTVSAACAETACPQHFLDGAPPRLVNEKLAVKTRELCNAGYAVLHSGVTRTGLWSAEHLTRERLDQQRGLERKNTFHAEPRLSADERAELADYVRSGYDRGHMAPSGDMPDPMSQNESFSLANMVPQNSNNNRNLWEGVESAVRDLTRKEGEVYVVTGSIFQGLARARGETYPGFTIGVTSTPLIGNVEAERHPETGFWHWKVADPEDVDSATWKLWQEGTRHEWAWPCPNCGEYFIPRFAVLRFDSSTPATAAKTAHLECPDCGHKIFDHAKPAMNARGVFVAPGQRVAPDGTVTGPEPEGDTISFWVSGLASPFVIFGKRAADYVRAVRSGDTERLQTVVNTRLGELFRNAAGGPAKAWEQIAALADAYATGEVPHGVQRLALTVDVQKFGLYYVIRGWGARYESWLLRAGYLPGETERPEVWNDLAELVDQGMDGEPFHLVLIDSGYRPGDKWRRPTNAVYDFCRRYPRMGRASAHAGGDVGPARTHPSTDMRIRTMLPVSTKDVIAFTPRLDHVRPPGS